MTTDEGGDAACWLHLVCDDCGAVVDDGVDHRCPPPIDRVGGGARPGGADASGGVGRSGSDIEVAPEERWDPAGRSDGAVPQGGAVRADGPSSPDPDPAGA